MGLLAELILNPELDLNLSSSDFIAVVSDIHIGAFNTIGESGNSHTLEFIQFLKLIYKNKVNCKGLLILGDFIDLIVGNYESIRRKQ